ncbi:pyridoxamine 5'-phosphate oxidase family protein [Anianabacter salinae]|uniref:pyridoxamine 5'-phosphate oxidase family protein n=1 Tax=Anianabacter salinae TaxID=2851023 RepID=UPI00225E2A1C|nr:pyridoxamine 5'-phosphate oxidase family protein [Anianabacter salinae]MBV0913656.1 pyridoxamine 5'-phosphate oxidase family protein [Anianabacter salinae]
MAQQFPALDDGLTDWIGRQHVFFAASAAADSRVNISPRPARDFRVLGPNRAGWLDQTGSGNETAAHMLADGRLTVMFCAFDGPPRILRLYGRGTVHARGSDGYAALVPQFDERPGARAIVTIDFDLVQTSCGYGVPVMDYREDRPTLDRWAETKGDDGLRDYWSERNTVSIDGLPTGISATI